MWALGPRAVPAPLGCDDEQLLLPRATGAMGLRGSRDLWFCAAVRLDHLGAVMWATCGQANLPHLQWAPGAMVRAHCGRGWCPSGARAGALGRGSRPTTEWRLRSPLREAQGVPCLSYQC